MKKPVIIGIGGPVGSGKTKLIEELAKRMYPEISLAAITDDIYTVEDYLEFANSVNNDFF